MPRASEFSLHGFDVSHYQPEAPDFAQGGRVFGFCKASEGTSFVDPHFPRNRAHLHAQNLDLIGFYHFARSKKNGAVAEAEHFARVVSARREGEVFALDYEETDAPWSQDWCVAFAGRFRELIEGPILFYSYRARMAAQRYDRIQDAFDGLWVASYQATSPVVSGWPWLFWQHTNGTNNPDPNSPRYDCSVFCSNDVHALREFAGTTPAPTPEPVPQPVPDPEVIPMNFFVLNDNNPQSDDQWYWWPELGGEKGTKAIVPNGEALTKAHASSKFCGDLEFDRPDLDAIPDLRA
jgi:lysozyme